MLRADNRNSREENDITERGGTTMKVERRDQLGSDLLPEPPKSARRALVRAGYVPLDQLTSVGEDEILQLHGMGPKAHEQLRRILAVKGQSCATRS
jgi:hypothetical protein